MPASSLQRHGPPRPRPPRPRPPSPPAPLDPAPALNSPPLEPNPPPPRTPASSAPTSSNSSWSAAPSSPLTHPPHPPPFEFKRPQDSILFGADEFELESERSRELAAGEVPLGIGAGTRLRRAIVDRNVRIGRNVTLVNEAGVKEAAPRPGGLPAGVHIREGIIVVRRSATVPAGTVV
jgi:hypothetical protein